MYFTNSILPIVNSTCGKSGCHGSVSRGAFSLTTYSQVVKELGTLSRLDHALKEMAEQKKERPSLDYTPPTSQQLDLLKAWIGQGAKNNSCNGCDTTQYTFAAVIAPLLNAYCVGCHSGNSPGGSVNLSTYSAIKAELDANPNRLVGSINWTSPYTGARQMPQGSAKLPDCYITQIEKWVSSGAPNN